VVGVEVVAMVIDFYFMHFSFVLFEL
jgi:hypothetical protein